MSLSRRQIRGLRSAGWEVVQEGPAVELRKCLRSLVRRRRRPLVHLPRKAAR